MLHFVTASAPFDAVSVWLMGSYMMRRTCRNISNLRIADSNEYRLHLQNRIYALADRVLRAGGWLQVVDRGEAPRTQLLIDDLFNSHRDQARPTSLDVFDVSYCEYTEPTDQRHSNGSFTRHIRPQGRFEHVSNAFDTFTQTVE